MVQLAGARNTPSVVARVTADPRFAARANRRVPRKIGSTLTLYDCISCDKCVPVCPNDANFVYDVEPVDLELVNYRWESGKLHEMPGERFTIARRHQIGNWADFCNDCGNCDVFCPEDGGPYIEKPRFFASLESWQKDRGGGFHVRAGTLDSIWGRFRDGGEHFLQVDTGRGEALFKSAGLELEVDLATHRVRGLRGTPPSEPARLVDMRAYHVLRTLLAGILDTTYVTWANTGRGGR
jgi:putative selenate reductase